MRTSEVIALQEAVMQITLSGVLTFAIGYKTLLPDNDLQAAWVHATLTVRLKATLRGHSAISIPVLEDSKGLLEAQISTSTLQGSASASGDLTTVLSRPKEGIDLVNGIAASTTVSIFAMHHANHHAVLT